MWCIIMVWCNLIFIECNVIEIENQKSKKEEERQKKSIFITNYFVGISILLFAHNLSVKLKSARKRINHSNEKTHTETTLVTHTIPLLFFQQLQKAHSKCCRCYRIKTKNESSQVDKTRATALSYFDPLRIILYMPHRMIIVILIVKWYEEQW